MSYSEPARTAASRARSALLVVGFACLGVLLAATAFAVAPHLPNDEDRNDLLWVKWPQRGQAALGTLTNYDPLISAGYAGKTGSDSAAEGCLAFFTQVTVGGRRLTAICVVMGQGEGSDTSVLLAAAGHAAEQLVDSITRAGRGRFA